MGALPRSQNHPPLPPLRHCRECGTAFYQRRSDQDFCQKPCRQAFNTRRYARGGELYDQILKWRLDREEGAWTDLSQLADQICGDERERRKQRKAAIEATKS